jgi:GT2 family glycosyltransferase
LDDINGSIAIGLPISWPHVHTDFFDSFTLLEKYMSHIIRASSGPIQEMRNTLVERALEMSMTDGVTHLLFLDADMVYPRDTIKKLWDAKKDIVGGLCFKRWPPFHPTLFGGEPSKLELIDPYPENEIIEVTATGTGCLLINLNVFAKIDYPWFEFAQTDEGRPIGEDVNFCYKARDAGIKIHVDTSIRTEHLAIIRVNDNVWKMNKKGIKSGDFKFTM